MTEQQSSDALAQLKQTGVSIAWTYGTIADEPTVTGGILVEFSGPGR